MGYSTSCPSSLTRNWPSREALAQQTRPLLSAHYRQIVADVMRKTGANMGDRDLQGVELSNTTQHDIIGEAYPTLGGGGVVRSRLAATFT